MGALGDVLEIVFGVDPPFTSVRSTVRQWRNLDVAERASWNSSDFGRRKESIPKEAGEARTMEALLSLSIHRPGRTRIECQRESDGEVTTTLTVVGIDRWWERTREGGLVSGDAHRRRETPLLSDAELHFDPATLREILKEVSLEFLGIVRTLGREGIHVRALPRPDARIGPLQLPYGCDEYEFVIDKETGVLLAVLGKYQGEFLETAEILSVAFDEPIDPDLFTYVPGPDEEATSPTLTIEFLTLLAAVERVPFAILIPTRIPDPDHSRIDVHYAPARAKEPESVAIMYRNFESEHTLWLDEIAVPDDPGASDSEEEDREGYDWEEVAVDGRSLQISDPGEGKRLVRFVQEGTAVQITSDYDRDLLIDMALSFVRA